MLLVIYHLFRITQTFNILFSYDLFINFSTPIYFILCEMGAMCGQSSNERTCLIPVKNQSSKIAIYGPPKTGKTSLISYLLNR